MAHMGPKIDSVYGPHGRGNHLRDVPDPPPMVHAIFVRSPRSDAEEAVCDEWIREAKERIRAARIAAGGKYQPVEDEGDDA